ncbi:MAG: FG-GAP-like repeat-containing protein, partial [Verrucomicrobia bacterium]|nr:FG-GAP-like repeat-containing protein [Verrucomicrobiota bacterium]
YDVERDPLSVQSWTQPAHGSVTHNGDGSFTYSATPGFIGHDTFTVVVGDGQGGFHRANMRVAVMSESSGGGVPVTQFSQFTALQANGTNMTHNGFRVPRLVDGNHDGKPDLLLGAGGYVWLYTNSGSPQAPAFGAGVKVQAAGADIYSGDGISPIAFVDMTGDGIQDLVVSDAANKLRVYRNTAAAGQPPVFSAPSIVKDASGADFLLPDRRFDLGDWDGDGKPDLVTGSFSGPVLLFHNEGTTAEPRFGTNTTLLSESYNIYPRIYDLNGNGLADFLRSSNWGDIRYWRDAATRGLGSPMAFSLTDSNGVAIDLHSLTDGAIVDFGDFNGDGIPDLVIGGHAGNKLYIAYGVRKTIADSIAAIEAIYDAHPTDLGVALSANTNALLNVVNNANLNLISHLQNGTLGTREALYAALASHISKYWFLKYRTLDTTNFHHVSSIALQNWVMLQYALADTPTRRTNTADVMGLTGTARTIFLENGLTLGDNAKSIPSAYGTIRDFRRRHPRELFPDAMISFDQYYGAGGGGFVWTPNSTKNTFGDWAVRPANEWAKDLTAAIEKVLGPGSASGDYFTFVMGHEMTHSLDAYVSSRANTDLRRRWGLMLCTAAGPDIIPGADGWCDWTATQTNFQAKGYWDGVATHWNAAWSNYWAVGYGSTFKNLSFMRFDISWFLASPQESLATQANHHWANALGRLIGATDRFRRGSSPGLSPLKANINEVVTFIDYQSAGLNRVNLVETKSQSSPKQVNWHDHYADLERNDLGYITRISVEGQTYDLTLDANGVVTNVISSVSF